MPSVGRLKASCTAEIILMFWRKEFFRTLVNTKECLLNRLTVLDPPLPPGPIVLSNILAFPFADCCFQAIYLPCPVLTESAPSGGVGRSVDNSIPL